MFTTLRNAWKIADLKKKMLFTLFIVLLYRVGNVVPVPFINAHFLEELFATDLSGTILGLYDAMSGSAFSQATVFALSIQPYINASIIIQLLTIAIPALERLSKDGGEEGKKKIAMITRYTTVGLGLLMGFAYYMMLKNYGIIESDMNAFLTAVVIILTFTAGSSFVMWLGDQITEFGIGNGISIILFANILSRIPNDVSLFVNMLTSDLAKYWYVVLCILVGALALIVFIVYINQSERRIPVQYAKRNVGRKLYGGQSTHLPIKVNMSGVLPIIFAQSIASLPATIATFVGRTDTWFYRNVFDSKTAIYAICYFILIFGFSYFYATIQYNPVEIANNLKKNGGFIPGFRPGRPTSDFIRRVISKITFFGALYLGVVAMLPIVTNAIFKINFNLAIGGTSVIIVVGVALETVQQMEAQMLMRHYKGFLE